MPHSRFLSLLFLAANLLLLPASHCIPVVCYYILNQPPIEDVPVDLCSHLILINSAHITENGELDASKEDLSTFSQLSGRTAKLLVSITSSNPSFSYLTADFERMTSFSRQLADQLLKFEMDGVDIDWEFPVWSGDATKSDRAQFATFLRILKEHLAPHGLILSVAVSGPPTISKVAYDVAALRNYADMVQIMNYDFHVFNKFSNPFVGFNAPIHPMRAEISILGEMNSEASMKTWHDMGLPKNISFFGIPTYVRAFQLLTHFLHKPYSPAIRSRPEITNYDQICLLEKDAYYKTVWNRHAQAPYLYGPDGLWASFENRRSVLAKMAFAKSWGAGGVMVFSVGSDDVTGKCGDGQFPLLREIKRLAQ